MHWSQEYDFRQSLKEYTDMGSSNVEISTLNLQHKIVFIEKLSSECNETFL